MSELSITTTQNVNINFNAASVGERILGYVLDGVIKIAYIIVIYNVVFKAFGLNETISTMDPWSALAIEFLFYLPVVVYSLVQESLFEGQTMGKRLMKIKVIKIDGYQAGFGDYFIRWLLRILDITSLFGLVGLISLLVSNKTQRIGDMAAGTAVISLKNNININHTILREISDSYIPVYPMVIKLSDNDVRIIKETYETSLRWLILT